MNKEEVFAQIDYWVNFAQDDLHCFPNDKAKEDVSKLFKALYDIGQLKWYILDGNKGLMVYGITPDFRDGQSVNELFMYIKPEFRGSIKLFKELVTHLEMVAIAKGCKSVRIASNIGYNDDLVLKVLQRWGYKTDVVVKYMG